MYMDKNHDFTQINHNLKQIEWNDFKQDARKHNTTLDPSYCYILIRLFCNCSWDFLPPIASFDCSKKLHVLKDLNFISCDGFYDDARITALGRSYVENTFKYPVMIYFLQLLWDFVIGLTPITILSLYGMSFYFNLPNMIMAFVSIPFGLALMTLGYWGLKNHSINLIYMSHNKKKTDFIHFMEQNRPKDEILNGNYRWLIRTINRVLFYKKK